MKIAKDRRVRRTHHALRAALVELTLEKGLRAVTIEEIIERADVARATFYAHFRDKDDLLTHIVQDLSADIGRRLAGTEQALPRGFTGLPLLHAFQYAEQERGLYQLILRGEGDGRALREFIELTCEQAERVFRERAVRFGVAPRVPFDVIARAWTGELVGILSWWVEGETDYTAAQITELLRDLSLRGRLWASGFPAQDYESDIRDLRAEEKATADGAPASVPSSSPGRS